jgi:hypothetical protein
MDGEGGVKYLMCRTLEGALRLVQVSFGAQCQATFQESRAQPPGNAFKLM